jgi:hypothetical protein
MDVCVAVNAEIKYLHLYSHDSVVICEIHIWLKWNLWCNVILLKYVVKT